MFVEKLKKYFELVSVVNKKAYTFKKTFDNGCYAEIVLIGPLERKSVRFWYFAELNVYDDKGERNPKCFKKGYASEAMSELLKVADDVDERLELSAYPQDNVISLEDLMDFYKDNMFKVRYGQEMYRDPLEEKKKRKKAGTESSKESNLRDWFKRKGAKGKKGGWVDCNAPDGKGGYKACGRSSGEKRKKYPACRPTPGACKERGRGKSWGKKGSKRKRNESMEMTTEELRVIIIEELQKVLDEKKGKKRVRKKKAKKDACYHKVKSRYKVWPSAYASGALSKCRKVGAKNWGNKSKKNESLNEEFQKHDMFNPETGEKEVAKVEKDHHDLAKKGYTHIDPQEIIDLIEKEGGALGMQNLLDKFGKDQEEEILKTLKGMSKVGQHKSGDYILDDGEEIKVVSESLQYHLDHGVGVERNVFRPGSSEFFGVFREARQLFREGKYKLHSEKEREIIESDLGEFGLYEGMEVPLDFPMIMEQDEMEFLDEKKKKKKKKDPPLNKPSLNTGGGKKWKVYVRSKSGGVKKVTYGDKKGGLKGNWNNAEARKSFAARHNCADKKDKTTSGYWACRAHKDFGTNVPGRFW